jgi:hypothetical protein
MDELVAPVHHRSGRSAKRAGDVLRFLAVRQEQDASILGFANRPERRSADAPLQLKGS